MNFSQFLSTVADAMRLLATYPVRWLALVLVFLVFVESLMFIPYIGFIVKMTVAGIVVAQVLAIFVAAAAGQKPNPFRLFAAFSLPVTSQFVLAGAALLPFIAGILFLYLTVGAQGIEYFFGNILTAKPPSPIDFERSKYVMQLAGLPFTFIAGAVIIKGLTGWAAITAALEAAVVNWLPALLLGLLFASFEWFVARLSSLAPATATITVVFEGVSLVLFLALGFALSYTVSAKVFAQAPLSSAL